MPNHMRREATKALRRLLRQDALAVDDPRDEATLMNVTAGILWIIAAAAGFVGLALPGTDHEHLAIAIPLFAAVIVFGVLEILLIYPRPTATLTQHAIVTASTMPVMALGLWVTGGANSYLLPLCVFPMLHVAYFFPLRLAWPQGVLLIGAFASPVLYDDVAVDAGYPARIATFAVAMATLMLAMQLLKGRLLAAEARQRTMALQDPMTGLANRRAFEDALAAAIPISSPARRAADAKPGTALVVFDLDAFKAVNDLYGHHRGDEVLCAVSEAVAAVVRDDDVLARIGGDEFAVIAPGAGRYGAQRLADDVADAVLHADTGDLDPVRGTVAWAVAPRDGDNADALMRTADRRLIEAKRLGPVPQRVAIR
jgi:diguanylate cyclase (GGDEF)-like protein